MPLFGRAKNEAVPPAPVVSPGPERLPDPPAVDGSGRRSVTDHRDYLLSQVASLRPFGIGLLEAAGLILCESIRADLDLPVYTSALVDGWAVRGSNLVGASTLLPVALPVVGEIDAVAYRGDPLTPGTAVKVAAGAPVPEGADAVVALADGVEVADGVEFRAEASFQQNLVTAGSRVADGEFLLGSGTVLDARSIALLAEVGHDKVLVRPRPRVVVATVGDDLVEPGLPLERLSQSYDATTSLIAVTSRQDGAKVFPIGIVPTAAGSLRRTLSEQLLRADLVLLAGVADEELAAVLGDLGAIDLAEVAMNPGGPSLFALIGDERTPVLVLPSDPFAALVSYLAFARPLIRELAGVPPLECPARVAPVVRSLDCDPTQTNFLLAASGKRGVDPLPGAGLKGTIDVAKADCLIVVQPGAEHIEAHSDVDCWLLRP
ncbi:MAG: gephyrin-like molybdotransferase Glp [Propionicimonas sp.]